MTVVPLRVLREHKAIPRSSERPTVGTEHGPDGAPVTVKQFTEGQLMGNRWWRSLYQPSQEKRQQAAEQGGVGIATVQEFLTGRTPDY